MERIELSKEMTRFRSDDQYLKRFQNLNRWRYLGFAKLSMTSSFQTETFRSC